METVIKNRNITALYENLHSGSILLKTNIPVDNHKQSKSDDPYSKYMAYICTNFFH